jgi:hypothetical protein
MNATGWSRGLEVTGGGTGVVSPPEQHKTVPPGKEGNPGARGTPGHPARQPGHRHTPGLHQVQKPASPPASGSHQPL